MAVAFGGSNAGIGGFAPRFLSTAGLTATGTTEQSLVAAGSGSMTIPAGWAMPGSTARLVIRGTLTTPVLSLGTSTFRFKTNGTTRTSGTTLNILGGMTGAGFVAYQSISFRSVGANGTAVCAGEIRYPSGGLTQRATVDMVVASPFSIDTTAPLTLDLTAQWTLIGHTVEAVTTTLELLTPMPS